MGLLRLSKDERKVCYKMVDMKAFKQLMKKTMDVKFKRLTGKRTEKFEYSDLVSYSENHLIDEDTDEIMLAIIKMIKTNLEKNFDQSDQFLQAITDMIEEKFNNDEEPENDYLMACYKEALEPFREDYEKNNQSACTFDMYTALFIPSLDSERESYQEQLDLAQQEKDIEKKLKDYEQLIKEKEDLEEELAKAKNDLKSLQNANNDLLVVLQKYQDAFNLEIYKRKLTGILKVPSLVNLTEEEIYERLNEEEKKSYEKEDYERVGNVLAAKYFLMKIRGVE